MSEQPLSSLVFLDEAGANLAMSRDYGRAVKNERLIFSRPYPRGHKYSIISAITHQEIIAAAYGVGDVDGDYFKHFIQFYLAPKLNEHHCLVMDNVAFHKMESVRSLIIDTGAKLIFLPPYSPDLSPIELMWSKLKSQLKKYAARCHDSFQQAIHNAFLNISHQDLSAWFKHCLAIK